MNFRERFFAPWINRITTRGTRRALRVARYEFKIQRLHQQALKKATQYAHLRGLKLNLGSGAHAKPGWVNIDLVDSADLRLDLREDFPFQTASAIEIYSEHFFEHLEFPRQATHFLREAFRVLAPGGVLSIGVPDTEWPLKAYTDDTAGYFSLAREKFHPSWCNTRLHQINFHFRQGMEHKYAYDFETLSAVLKKNGFSKVYRREFDPARDSTARAIGTLYVDAVCSK